MTINHNYRPDYASEIECANRLIKDYNCHGNICVAFDFDNTLFDYHGDNPKNISACLNLLRRCQDLELDVIIWTCSGKERYDQITEYLNEEGIYCFNINATRDIYNFVPLSPKPFFSILLDDRAGLGSAIRSLSLFLTELEQ